jgi:hypothetical protein
MGVQSRLGSRRSVRVVLLKSFHELERHLSSALSPNKLAERESTVAVNAAVDSYGSAKNELRFMVPRPGKRP